MAEPTVSDQFIEYLKRVEGQSGLQPEGHYVPAASLEGGSPTIGYGHKLGPGEHVESMGQESAIALLKDDARYAELLARRRVDSAFGDELTHRNDLFLKTFLPHTAAAEGGL